MDDLAWVASEGEARPSTRGQGRGREANEDKSHAASLRVQVLIQDTWRDCDQGQARQIVTRLERGELQFMAHANGQNYRIDFADPDNAKQVNATSGTTRKLRILEPNFEELAGDLEGEKLEAPFASGCSSGSGGSRNPVTRAWTWSGAPAAGRPGGRPAADVALRQRELGPQSKRGGATEGPLRVLQGNTHAEECFRRFQQNEEKLCGEWAVFYHSYSFAALIYEVQAAVGSVLFRFRSQYAPLPRLLVKDFAEIPNAPELVRRFSKDFAQSMQDHHPNFRKVAISAMCSLASLGPEACVAMVFVAGYSCKDLSFRSVLENLLRSCYVPKLKVKALAERIIALAEKHGLDVSQFGGKACQSGRAGHLLQIFVKRPLVDQIAYAAKPYGPVDKARMPLSKWLNSNTSFQVGQARLVAHPRDFMRADRVRMYVASADPTFHHNRREFQEELVHLLWLILGDRQLREKAANGLYGGPLPPWWSPDDQRQHENY